MLDFCVRLVALNQIMDQMVAISQQNLAPRRETFAKLMQTLLGTQADCLGSALKLAGLTWGGKVAECLVDVDRAAQIAASTRQAIPQAPGTSTVQ